MSRVAVFKQLLNRIFSANNARWILLFFAVYFGLITFVNHYLFRTSSDPLGIYSNALFDYAHFRANDCTLLSPLNAELETPFFDNKLSDHFNLIQFVFAPFYFIFGTYTLLIFQWIAVLLGGWGVFQFFRQKPFPEYFASMAMTHYFAFFAWHSAFAFDYHDNVVGASALPWLFLFLKQERWKAFSLILLLAVACKENIPVFLFFIFGVLFLFPFEKSKKQRVMAMSASAFCLLYFLGVTKIIMPALANEGRESYLHFHYSALGESYGEAIKFAIGHPWDTIKMFFTNHTGDRWGSGIKAELYLVLLLSGSFAWFFRPAWLLMAIPIIAQKVLNDQILKWGINYHYSVELAAISTFAFFIWLSESQKVQKKWIVALLVIGSTFGITISKYFGRTAKWYDQERQNVFSPKHYKRAFDIAELHNALALIPNNENVAVSAHFHLVPHIPFRKDIYEFPIVENAEYIAVLLNSGTYPLKTKEAFDRAVAQYLTSEDWVKVYEGNSTIILQKKP